MRVVLCGAAGGIGRQVADRLLGAGHDIVGLDRDADGVSDLPDAVDGRVVDLSDEEAVKRALADTEAEAVVSSVGWYELGAIEDCSPDAFREHFEANVLAVHTPIRELLPELREREGRIVVVGSMVGSVPLPYHGAYSTAKAGLAGYLDSLRREIGPKGVDVTLVEPGPVRTGFNERAADALDRHADSAYAEQYRAYGDYSPDAATPAAVAERIRTALEADDPRARYRVSARARWLPRLAAVLPAPIYDRIVRSGLPGGLLHRLIDR
jgi:NAD(P)-dependent dehydrogenase (short-subunit alcohol dehydrogenase family)